MIKRQSFSLFQKLFKRILYLLFFGALLISNCGKKASDEKKDIEYTPETAKMVSHITDGMISQKGTVCVKFVAPMVKQEQVDIPLKKTVFSFDPELKGVAKWEKLNTLIFVPDEPMLFGREYSGKLDMKSLLPEHIEKELQDLEFRFSIAYKQILKVEGDFAYLNENDPVHLIFRGTVRFNEPVEPQLLKKALIWKQGFREKHLEIRAKDNNKEFSFTSSLLLRGEKEQKFHLQLEKELLSIAQTFEKEYIVPPLQTLKVTEVNSRKTTEASGIEIYFSDPLDPAQDIRGLISIRPEIDFRLTILGKKVFINADFEFGHQYNVDISAGIRSKWADKLEENFSHLVEFGNIKPQMAFSADGVFLPSSNEQKIRFNTVNLTKVRLQLTKVFDNNLCQFLQDNKLSSSKDRDGGLHSHNLKNVGITVAEKVLDLGNEKNQWRQNELDLSRLISEGETGLFIVHLKFLKKDMIWEKDEDSHHYGNDYYTNPNSRGYFYRHGEIKKPLIITDIGLTCKKAGEDYYVYTTDIHSAKPLSGVSVKLKSYQNQIIAEKISNSQGQAIFKKINDEVFYIVAESDGQQSIIKRNEMRWNLSGFDVEGEDVPGDETQAFIYTERGVYRPADLVNVAAIFRNNDNTFPKDHPVRLTIFNPKNQKVHEEINKKATDGFYHFKYQISSEVMTGNWTIKLIAGSKTFQHNLKIETVVPYRLKIKLETEKERLTIKDEKLELDIISNYLFGSPAADLKAELEVKMEGYLKKFDKFPGFFFGNGGVKFSPLDVSVWEGKLDKTGKSHVEWDLPTLKSVPSAVNLKIDVSVFEKGGRPNHAYLEIPIEPYTCYTGLNIPEFEYGYSVVGKSMKFQTIVLDSEGTVLSGVPLKYKIYKNNTYWWWEYRNRRDFEIHFKKDVNTELITEGSVISRSTVSDIEFVPEQRGRYLIEVSADIEGGHRVADFFYASHWGEPISDVEGANIIVLKKNKEKYNPGDKANISFPKPKEGSVLITVEKSDQILSSKWINPEKIDANDVQIEIPITKEMTPNAYVTVSVIQTLGQTLNDRPIRMYGIIPLLVEEPSYKQNVEIVMPDELRSGEDFEVEIQTQDSLQTQFTIAVVDEGLLALTAFQTPDAWQKFYAKQSLKVKTWDIFSQIIGVNKGDVFRTFAIGGGVGAYRKSQQAPEKARRFKAVAMFKGPIMTDEFGNAKVSFEMDDYIGAVRVMVVTAKRQVYGKAEKTVPVKKELMVLPNLPRVLAPGDKITMPVSIFAMKDSIGEVEVKVDISGPVGLLDESTKNVEFTDTGEKGLDFSLYANPETGLSQIRISATSEKYSAESITEIAVKPSSPRIYKTITKTCTAGNSITMKIPDDGIKGTNEAALYILKRPNMDFEHRLAWLENYPYGCVEQVLSAVFPKLLLKQFIAKNDNEQRQLDFEINKVIRELRKYQLPSGGFAYWPGLSKPSNWGTNYAGRFLLEAKKLGYNVPSDMYANWLRFEKSGSIKSKSLFRRIFSTSNRRNRERLQRGSESIFSSAYRLYLLALAGEAQFSSMNILKENSLKEMTDPEKWLLAAAYKLAGSNQANNIIGKNDLHVKDYTEMGDTYRSYLRDKAIILEMLIEFGYMDKAGDLFEEISARMSTHDWYSTQTTAYSLFAMGKYMEANAADFGGNDMRMAGNIILPDGATVAYDTQDLKFIKILESGFGKEIIINVSPETQLGKTYISIDWNGVPMQAQTEEISNNLKLEVSWVDEDDMKIDVENIRQGSTFWGKFRVRCKRDMSLEELALVQVLPSGWEIENIRLSGENLPRWMRGLYLNREEYCDIRDDRIMWFFDLPRRQKHLDFVVKVNAVTLGDFRLPPTLVETMYDDNYKALKKSSLVSVVK